MYSCRKLVMACQYWLLSALVASFYFSLAVLANTFLYMCFIVPCKRFIIMHVMCDGMLNYNSLV